MFLRGILLLICRGLYIVGIGCEDINLVLVFVDRCYDFSVECLVL